MHCYSPFLWQYVSSYSKLSMTSLSRNVSPRGVPSTLSLLRNVSPNGAPSVATEKKSVILRIYTSMAYSLNEPTLALTECLSQRHSIGFWVLDFYRNEEITVACYSYLHELGTSLRGGDQLCIVHLLTRQ